MKPHKSEEAGQGSPRSARGTLLFLLKDDQGRALLMTMAASRAEAEAFGRNNLPRFRGNIVELDPESLAEAEEFWGVRTVRVVNQELDPHVSRGTATAVAENLTVTKIWTKGLELPEEVVCDNHLTAEDHRDLALDHIARTCRVVIRLEIRKWA